MTRKLVARESDVSERHLAQLEAGEGNVSIVLLRRIAAALNVSLVKLFAPEVEEHTSELQSHLNLVCRLLLEKKKMVFRLMRDVRGIAGSIAFRQALPPPGGSGE